MLKRCSVCASPALDGIHEMLASGASLRQVEAAHGVSKSALERHTKSCAAELLQAARGDRAAASGAKLDAELVKLAEETRAVLEEARNAKDWGLALRAIARLEQQLAIRVRLEGEGDGTTVNVAVQVNLAQSEEWRELRGLILAALPDAGSRLALAAALEKGGY